MTSSHFIGISCETKNKTKNFAEYGWVTFGLVNEDEYQKIISFFSDNICQESPWVDCYHQNPTYKLTINESNQSRIQTLVETFGQKWIIGVDLFELFCETFDNNKEYEEDD